MKKNLTYFQTHLDEILIQSKLFEQETVINYPRQSDEAIIYTSDPTTWTKLKKSLIALPDSWKLSKMTFSVDNEITSVTVTAPKKHISFRKKLYKNKTESNPQITFSDIAAQN